MDDMYVKDMLKDAEMRIQLIYISNAVLRLETELKEVEADETIASAEYDITCLEEMIRELNADIETSRLIESYIEAEEELAKANK